MSDDLKRKFLEYCNELNQLDNWSISRHCIASKNEIVHKDLVGFYDASNVLFERSINIDGEIETGFICSRMRVAPLKPSTIPWLELQGAVLLSELLVRVAKVLGISWLR